jgi:hypothetical protein
MAAKAYPEIDPDDLAGYVVDNVSRHSVIVLNSDKAKSFSDGSASNPTSLFTIIIGGNIVSRGVTFNNLLSMFFTRDVKNKIQQDTYIQRARMFGARGNYLRHFELTIPEQLYTDWHRCFVFHKLALAAIRDDRGSPVWLGDSRIQTVSSSSIDKSTVDLDAGEMKFGLFSLSPGVVSVCQLIGAEFDRLRQLSELVGEAGLPQYLIRFIASAGGTRPGNIYIRKPATVENMKDADKENIDRAKGLMGQVAREGNGAQHNIGIFYNDKGMARFVYKYEGSVQFIKNVKNVRRV